MNEEEYEELARWLPCHPGRWVAWPEPFGTRAAALMAFVCARLGVGVPWLPSGLHAVSALSGLTAGASPVLHSDMGWQYRHPWWRERLGELGIRQSMSRKGNCLDNAATEQVFGHLKDEFYTGRRFASFEQFKQELNSYIVYWNTQRRQEQLNGRAPIEFREMTLTA